MRLLQFILSLLLGTEVAAQMYTHLGLQATNMRNTGPIDTKGMFVGIQHGIGYDVAFTSTSSLRFGIAIQHAYQGYHQQKAGETYHLRMHYLQWPFYLAYPLAEQIQIETGGYVSGLLRARHLHNNENQGVIENYKTLDYGLLAGLVFFEKELVNVWLRYQHGLTNQLEYPEFLPSGEQVDTYRLLKPAAITLGLRINFWEHE